MRGTLSDIYTATPISSGALAGTTRVLVTTSYGLIGPATLTDISTYLGLPITGTIPSTNAIGTTGTTFNNTTFADLAGLSCNITLTTTTNIHGIATLNFSKTAGGAEVCSARIYLVSPAEDGETIQARIVNSNDIEGITCQFHSTALPAGTYTLKVEALSVGGGTLQFLSGDLFVQGQEFQIA